MLWIASNCSLGQIEEVKEKESVCVREGERERRREKERERVREKKGSYGHFSTYH